MARPSSIPITNSDQYNLPGVTYGDVNDVLAGDEEKAQTFRKIVPSIHQMATLHGIHKHAVAPRPQF